MLNKILEVFADSPAQQKVVRFLLENGLGVDSEYNHVVVNGVEISASALARKIGVDRRVVDTTIRRICDVPDLLSFFSHMRVTPDITEVAKNLGLSVITVLPRNAEDKNVVASAVAVLADYNLNLRQIFVTDPYIVENPRLVLIIDGTLPTGAIEALRALPAVDSIIF